MFIEFRCRCGHEFRTRNQNIGLPIICPNCTAHLVVPDPAESPAAFPLDDEQSEEVQEEKSEVKANPLLAMLDEETAWPILGKRAEPVEPEPSEKVRSRKAGRDPERKSSRRSESSSKRRDSRRSSRRDFDRDLDRKPERRSKSSASFEFIPDENIFDAEASVFGERSAPRKRTDDEADIETGHKESRKPRAKQGSDANLPVIIGGVVFGLIVLGIVGFFAVPQLVAKLKEGGSSKVPQEFEAFVDNDIPFRCEVPKGWEVEARGGSGNIPPSVRIEKGSIKISYRSSQSGAAIQDMAQAGANQSGELRDELKPVAKVHDYQREKFKAENPDYKEIGGVERIETGMGEGRLSEFTGTVGFGKQYGYRVTLLTAQHQWNVVCKCTNKRDFEAYKPIFRRIIESSGR